MAQITFDDKVATRESSLPRENSVTAEDLNEIKAVVNENAGQLGTPTYDEVLTQGNVSSLGAEHTSGVLSTVIDPDGVRGIDINVPNPTWDIDTETGLATFKGGLIGGESIDPSAISQIDSTAKGVLIPRMTESEMNAISSAATGLSVFNTTRDEEMYYSAIFGWIGGPLNMMMGTATTATVTSTTYYFSITQGLTLRSTIVGLAVRPTKKGKIIGASFTRFISSILGDRSYSLYVRINNANDYLVATQAATALETFFSNSAMNATGIPVDVTDSIVMKLVVSGGTTDSTNVLFFGNLLIR